MATLIPTISTVLATIGTAKTVMDTVQDLSDVGQKKKNEQSLTQLRQKQKLAEQELAAKTAADKEKLSAETASAEAVRKAALKRAMAKQTASFGGQGVTSTGGSADAVLLGLYQESDAERLRREQLDTIKTKALDSNLDYLKKQNLLAYQQTLEQQKLARLV